MPQDTAFSSLFFKVLMQMLQWLENPAVEDGPLNAQLKSFAVQYSARHRINDGAKHCIDGGAEQRRVQPKTSSRVQCCLPSPWVGCRGGSCLCML